MRVQLRQLPDGKIAITRLEVLGGPLGTGGATVVIGPGERFRGYRHRRLRRLGDGVHVLRPARATGPTPS